MRTKQPVTDSATRMSEPIPITSERKRAAARGRTAASAEAASSAIGALEPDVPAGPKKRATKSAPKRAPKASPTRAEIVAASRAERAALDVARQAVDVAQ